MLNNQKIKEVYEECSKRAEEIFKKGFDTDIPKLNEEYDKRLRKYPTQSYSREGFIKLRLCTRELSRKLGITDYSRFNSPPEVLACFGLELSWVKGFVLVNQIIGEYETDLTLIDVSNNFVLLIDVQGFLPHNSEDQKKKDEEKKKYYEQNGYSFIQVSGSFIKNDLTGFIQMVLEKISESYEKQNVSFLCSNKKVTLNNTVFRRKA